MPVLAERVTVTQPAGSPFPSTCECGLPSDGYRSAACKIGLPHLQLPDPHFYYRITPFQRSQLHPNSSLLKYVFNERDFKRGRSQI